MSRSSSRFARQAILTYRSMIMLDHAWKRAILWLRVNRDDFHDVALSLFPFSLLWIGIFVCDVSFALWGCVTAGVTGGGRN
ncbi:hypothetical protein LZ32DRAFT_601390, partial [Colletotrichum eremochloae]